MQKLILFYLLIFSTSIFSQNNYDKNWVLSGSIITFDSEKADTQGMKMPLSVHLANAQICDKYGNLQFYTNGCYVANWKHKFMENGDSINAPGRIFGYQCKHSGDLTSYQGIIALPIPERDSEYVIIHQRRDDELYDHSIKYPQSLLATFIDMRYNNGEGKVTAKNVFLKKDTLCNRITAVRHGNGRDWWIAAPTINSDEMILLLLTPDGLSQPISKKLPLKWEGIHYVFWGGQCCFSRQGNRFAHIDGTNGLHVFDFDRCTGDFSNGRKIKISGIGISDNGVAFSPNGRFVYVSNNLSMHQFDLNAPDISKSEVLIGEFDGFEGPLATKFYQMKLAPNNKIYMSGTNGTYYLHTIHRPNLFGKACDFRQHDYRLPDQTWVAMPNFPHFVPFDWENSPCDTIFTEPTTDKMGQFYVEKMSVLPNPTHDYLSVYTPNNCGNGSLRIFSMDGKLVYENAGAQGSQYYEIDISHLATAMYILVLNCQEGILAQKIVKF